MEYSDKYSLLLLLIFYTILHFCETVTHCRFRTLTDWNFTFAIEYFKHHNVIQILENFWTWLTYCQCWASTRTRRSSRETRLKIPRSFNDARCHYNVSGDEMQNYTFVVPIIPCKWPGRVTGIRKQEFCIRFTKMRSNFIPIKGSLLFWSRVRFHLRPFTLPRRCVVKRARNVSLLSKFARATSRDIKISRERLANEARSLFHKRNT